MSLETHFSFPEDLLLDSTSLHDTFKDEDWAPIGSSFEDDAGSHFSDAADEIMDLQPSLPTGGQAHNTAFTKACPRLWSQPVRQSVLFLP